MADQALRVVFMGTPSYAQAILRALCDSDKLQVVGVVTRPDAISGRGKTPQPSPVREFADAAGIPVVTATSLKGEEVQGKIAAMGPDILAVAAFGALLPDEVLAIPTLGSVNVHASLLPRWRGAAPMQRAILAGDERVGFSIMRIGHLLDQGPWCLQRSVSTGDKTYPEISRELSQMAGEALREVLEDWAKGIAPDWNVQDDTLATYAEKIDKRELLLDPAQDALTNRRRVQASSDEAPARCKIAGRGVRVTRAALVADGALPTRKAGDVDIRDGRVLIFCADAPLEVLEVKPDGKREMDARAFAAGLRADALVWEAI